MKNKIKYLGKIICSRRDRLSFVKLILTQLLLSDFQIFVFVKKECFFLPNNLLKNEKKKGFRIFYISELCDAEKGAKLLKKIKLWHKPIFHILITHKMSKESLLSMFGKTMNKLPEIESYLNPYCVGFIDPLDDYLEWYGEEKVKYIFDRLKEKGSP